MGFFPRNGWDDVRKDRENNCVGLLLPKIDIDQTEPGGVAHQIDGSADSKFAHNSGAATGIRHNEDRGL